MTHEAITDGELVLAIPKDRDAFTIFYRRHVRENLGFLRADAATPSRRPT
jgi:hypothetical protein